MQVGFYGKLPSHGDFLRRRVSDAFVDAWDALAARVPGGEPDGARRPLARRLPDEPGVAIRRARRARAARRRSIGLLAPSVDQVGRYFPLTLVAELPDGRRASSRGRGLDALLRQPPSVWSSRRSPPSASISIASIAASPRWSRSSRAIDRSPADSSSIPAARVGARPRARRRGSCRSARRPTCRRRSSSCCRCSSKRSTGRWCSGGPTGRRSSSRAAWSLKGLPGPALYPAFLEGSWAEHRWRSVPGARPGRRDAARHPLAGSRTRPLSFRSAAATDVGRARSNNEDGFVERPEAGLWAVADGMGGHSHGEVASRMVCDALADFPLDGTFEEAVEAAHAAAAGGQRPSAAGPR